MSREMKGKRVLLTGASGGIGQALAMALAREGARIALASRDEGKLKELETRISQLGVETVAIPTDLTKSSERTHLVRTTVEAFGGVDLLINNAGIGSWGHFSSSSESILRQVMEVNFFAPVELTRLALPYLTQGEQPGVVNVTSMCGRKAMPGWSEYSASKFGLVGMAEAWRAEFARFGVDVITIVPGMTNSGFRDNWLRSEGRAKLQFEKGMTPDYLAKGIIRAIQNNRRELVIGSEARRLLRFDRFFPRITDWLLAREMTKLYRTN